MRFKALVEYEGTAYYGFQRQIDEQPTIQGELEKTLSQLAAVPITVRGAGRTDSGVHAWGQVISFDLDWQHEVAALERALNANLPKDIAVYHLEQVHERFHPRYDARRRTYEYHIYNQPNRSPLRRFRSWQVAQPLDMAKMNEAAALLIGTQDFATFGRSPQGNNTVRELFQAQWRRESELLIFTIEANAFLYRMVRTIVGTLQQVGSGRWTVEQFRQVFQAKKRSQAAALAPPHGLYLMSITYE